MKNLLKNNIVMEFNQKKFYSLKSHFFKLDNVYSLDEFSVTEALEFSDFFEKIFISRKTLGDTVNPSDIENPLDKDNDFISMELYNHFYVNFMWDYYLYIKSKQSEYLNNMHMVFYKSDPNLDFALKKKYNKFAWYGNKDNILLYKTFYAEDLDILKSVFVSAYLNDKYNILHTIICALCNDIIRDLNEIIEDRNLSLKDLYMNYIIPEYRYKCFDSIVNNKELKLKSDIWRRIGF